MRALRAEKRAARLRAFADRTRTKNRRRNLQRMLGGMAAKAKQLINHFGIDISNPDSHEFLFDQMKIFFYDEGVELAQIDTSKEGNVNW
jgi:hypothetical protein